MDDRRVFARIDAQMPLRFLDPSSGQEGKGDTFDVSANGLGLLTDNSLAIKTPLEIWLDIPDHHDPFYTRGEVAWCEPSHDSPQKRIGIQLEKAELMGLARVMWLKRRNQ